MQKRKNMNWGFDVANLDKSVRPQDDFFQYANGGWLKKNPIPKDESRWGTFYILRKKSREALKEVLEGARKQKVKPGSNLQKLRDYYLSGMDIKSRNRKGVAPLKPYLDAVEGLKTKEDIIRLSGVFRAEGIGSLWRVGADQDMKQKNIVRLYIEQGGLGLPDRDYYLKTDKKSKEIRKKYLDYMAKLHKMVLGKADKAALKKIIKIETGLAEASMTRVELRDLEKQYNKMTFAELKKKYPSVDWDSYFGAIGASKSGGIIVCQPLFLKKVNVMLKTIPQGDWKCYFRWAVLNAFPAYLSENLANTKFDFYGKTLSGIKKMKPGWERAAMDIDAMIGDALGELYVKKYFPESAKREIGQLVNNLISAYRKRMIALGWMGEATKKKALDKLGAFIKKLGYPDKWKNYSKVKISPDSFIENHIAGYKFEFTREMSKIGKKPDKKEWGMTPSTVNAYYNSLFCEIVFPAAIMQPPFFDPSADDAVNYGAIGSVIGHELTHGFDDKGSTFDKNGEMKNWWSKRDRKLFMEKANGLVHQYNKYEALPGVFVNGNLTLGENIADLGGLTIAYHAFKKSQASKNRKTIDGFTPEQRFFLGFAQGECGKEREESTRLSINTDPHSPSKSRVNLPLSNMTEFYEAFGVKNGDKMWRPEKDRVVIW